MESDTSGFEEWMKDVHLRSGQIYRQLANAGVRVFCIDLTDHGRSERQYWFHDQKTVTEWRQDIRNFMAQNFPTDENGRADDDVFNALSHHLHDLGYSDVGAVVVDVFEGRVSNHRARLIHNPAHEEQDDGFGHYGWESKKP